MKIDMHAHILPARLPDWKAHFGYGGFITLQNAADGTYADMVRDDGKFFRRIQPNCWDASVIEAEMNTQGINQMVLCTVPVMFNYHILPKHGLAVAQFLNDDIANAPRQIPSRFHALGTLPMQDTDMAINELERCVKELGLPGVQIGSHINAPEGWLNLNEARLFPIFEAAQDLGACIMVHPWDMMSEQQMSRYWLPWLVGMPAETSLAICSMIFGGVFERLPRLRVCFAHAGGSFVGTFGRIRHGWTVRPDLVAIDNPHDPAKYLGQFWVDSHTCDPDMLLKAIDLFGSDKICFGTDYPFPLGEWDNGQWAPGSMLNSMTNLPEEIRANIYHQNVKDWLLGNT